MAIINGHMGLCSAPITTPWRFVFARQGWPQERLGLSIYCLSRLTRTLKGKIHLCKLLSQSAAGTATPL